MEFTETILGEGGCWMAWAIWAPAFVLSVRRADWPALRHPARLNLWLGMIALLVLVWSMKAGVQPGLTLHLVGANLLTLCVGPGLAFLGLNAVLLGVVLNTGSDFLPFAANALLLAGCGVAISHGVSEFIRRRLPAHFFVFVFLNGFFGAAATIVGIGIVSTTVLSVVGAYHPGFLLEEFLPYFILLAFSEAWLSGMLLTLFVVYRPDWVGSFDDRRYLRGK